MKILVVGGAGFIGSHVVDSLVLHGHEVKIFGRRLVPFNDGVDFIVGDFHDISKLAEAMIGVDVVIHSLSTVVPMTSARSPVDDVKSNLLGTIRLLDLMRREAVSRLIYLSSGGTVYGNPIGNPVKESATLNPISSYGAVKAAVESFINVARVEWGLESVVIRPSNPYGERQVGKLAQGLISNLLRCAIERKPITIFGNGDIIRDYVYVKDLARLITLAVSSDFCGVLNAGSGVGFSVNEIVDVVERETSYSFEKHYRPARSFDVKEIVLDCAAASEKLQWSANTAIDVGISRQYAYMMNGDKQW